MNLLKIVLVIFLRFPLLMNHRCKRAGMVMLTLLVFASGCTQKEEREKLTAGPEFPDRLSAWNLFKVEAGFQPAEDVIHYSLNSELFTDYASKFRTIYVPDRLSIQYRDREVLEFPPGSILSKTFYYPDEDHPNGMHIIETRLLVNSGGSWVALPYIWDENQSDAYLKITGGQRAVRIETAAIETTGNTAQNIFADTATIETNYQIPDKNQCAACHVVREDQNRIIPLGPKARHLNLTLDNGENQLIYWEQKNILEGLPDPGKVERSAVWYSDEPLKKRIEAYLDINCSHCHRTNGPARTSGLILTPHENSPFRRGVCKPPVAAGRGSGGFRFNIMPESPEKSIMLFRISSNEAGVMMPELGRTIVDQNFVSELRNYINNIRNCQDL